MFHVATSQPEPLCYSVNVSGSRHLHAHFGYRGAPQRLEELWREPCEIFVADLPSQTTVTQTQLLQTFFRQDDMKLRLVLNLLCVDGLEPLIFQPALYGPAIIDRCQALCLFSAVLGVEPRALCTLGRRLASRPEPPAPCEDSSSSALAPKSGAFSPPSVSPSQSSCPQGYITNS